MKPKPRWMKSVIEAAQDETIPLPFARRAVRWRPAIKSQGKPTLARG